MMRKFTGLSLVVLLFLYSCENDKTLSISGPDPKSGYPADVSVIINNKCSTPGCHTESSKAAAGGLALETWDKLLEGGASGAVAIAYRPDQSWITYYTNTDTNKGV